MYSFPAEAGVTTVKTDVQYLLDQVDDAKDRRELITTYLDAWSAAVFCQFEGSAISSMSQMLRNLFQNQLLPNKPRVVVRKSDDFFPDGPTSHSWHISCNAHYAVLTQHLDLVPEWDMFQTNHAYSSFHNVYITDKPGFHNLDLYLPDLSEDAKQNDHS